jgi:intracellular septation protein A
MLATVVRDAPAEMAWRMRPSKVAVVAAVTKRLVPYLIEATLIPMVLFYGFLLTLDLRWAFVAALGWSYAAVARRIVSRRPVPALLMLACLGITLRTSIYLCSGNTFVYFVQPILRTLATAAMFAGSVLIGRPLIARFASDFCPLSPEVQGRPAVVRLFRRLTYLWACVNLAAALVTLTLLLTVPTAVFVGTATLAAWLITCAGVVLTVSDSVRTARGEGLATAVARDGSLRASAVVQAIAM